MPDSVAFEMVDRVSSAYLGLAIPLVVILLACVVGLIFTKRTTH